MSNKEVVFEIAKRLFGLSILVFMLFTSCKSFVNLIDKNDHTYYVTKYKVTENGVSKTMVFETFDRPSLYVEDNYIILRSSDKGVFLTTKGNVEKLEQKTIIKKKSK